MHTEVILWCTVGLILSICGPTFAQDEPTLKLALQLAEDRDHDGAAIEFRRLALESEEDESRGAFYWAAAYEYLEDGKHDLVADVLDRAEDASPDIARDAMLLRAESAAAEQRWDESSFYLESVVSSPDDASAYARRKLAGVRLRSRDFDEARTLVVGLPVERGGMLAAIDAYEQGQDKNPKLGGWLGLLPGMGYLYAGEKANALRSLILNSIFIFGMVETAEDDEWGAFAVITFFEVTWYSGSIYGGIDASHRYNRQRLEDAVTAIEGGAGFTVEREKLPSVSLKFRF